MRRPRKATVNYFACRMAQLPRVLFYRMLSTNRIVGTPARLQPVQALGDGRITVGADVSIGYYPSPAFFSSYCYLEARYAAASISIGAGTRINNDFRAISEFSAISIGERCLVGTGVEILGSDFHALTPEARRGPDPRRSAAVTIGDKVFVGSNARILKGVNIGSGAVIANGSVVSSDVPPNAVVGGNPARVIRVLERRE